MKSDLNAENMAGLKVLAETRSDQLEETMAALERAWLESEFKSPSRRFSGQDYMSRSPNSGSTGPGTKNGEYPAYI